MQGRYIIVGAGWSGKTIAGVFASKFPAQLIGFVEDKPQADMVLIPHNSDDEALRCPVLGHSRDLYAIAKKHNADGVITAVTHHREDHLINQVLKCYETGIPVYEMADFYVKIAHKVPVHHVNDEWIAPNLTAPKNNLYIILQDIINYLLSVVGCCCVFLPLCPLIALLIRCDSRGPVFYQQERVGIHGKPFVLLKFRTMIHGAENGKALWAKPADRRVTRVGRLLRKFRIDELPQFISVLQCRMALIGPRPERPQFVSQLEKEIPYYSYRHLVRPGITGWAQVNYRYGNTVDDALEKLQLDLYWIKNRSFFLDLRILFKSVKVVLSGFGAF